MPSGGLVGGIGREGGRGRLHGVRDRAERLWTHRAGGRGLDDE